MSSILTDIKKLFGIPETATSFDTDLIIHINSVFTVLNQLSVGPSDGFKITGSSEEWESFITNTEQLELVKTYVFLKVKLMFDISTMTSPLIDVINKQITEFEWRLNASTDPGWKKEIRE